MLGRRRVGPSACPNAPYRGQRSGSACETDHRATRRCPHLALLNSDRASARRMSIRVLRCRNSVNTPGRCPFFGTRVTYFTCHTGEVPHTLAAHYDPFAGVSHSKKVAESTTPNERVGSLPATTDNEVTRGRRVPEPKTHSAPIQRRPPVR